MHFFPTAKTPVNQTAQLSVLFDAANARTGQDFFSILSEHVAPANENAFSAQAPRSAGGDEARQDFDGERDGAGSALHFHEMGEAQDPGTASHLNGPRENNQSHSPDRNGEKSSQGEKKAEHAVSHQERPVDAADDDDGGESPPDESGDRPQKAGAGLVLPGDQVRTGREDAAQQRLDRLLAGIQALSGRLENVLDETKLQGMAGLKESVDKIKESALALRDVSSTDKLSKLKILDGELTRLQNSLDAAPEVARQKPSSSKMSAVIKKIAALLHEAQQLVSENTKERSALHDSTAATATVSARSEVRSSSAVSTSTPAMRESSQRGARHAMRESSQRVAEPAVRPESTDVALPESLGRKESAGQTASAIQAVERNQGTGTAENAGRSQDAVNRSQPAPTVQAHGDRRLSPALDADSQPQGTLWSKNDSTGGVKAASEMSGSTSGQKQPDARQGFFGSTGQDQTVSGKASTLGAGKMTAEGEFSLNASGQQQTTRSQQPVPSRTAEVYRQVETGAFRNLGQGTRQLVLRLDPADLGQVSVVLQVRGKEVHAVMRTTTPEASHALGEQLGQLRAQLEAQGLRVGRLEVQTELADSQTQGQWQGAEQHNRYQENREFAMSAQRWRVLGRIESEVVRDVQTPMQREKNSRDGLDIFA